MISHFCDEEDHFNALPANLSYSKSTSKGTSIGKLVPFRV
jgi:hypothetical protein